MKEETKNPEKTVEYTLMLISAQKHIKNGIESILDSDGKLWLNKKYIEKGLDFKICTAK